MTFHIVEDDTAVADALLALLRGAGHEAIVSDSAEGLLAAGPPPAEDTVIVDLGLPGISGSMLLRWLFSLNRPPRVIAISGQSSKAIARELASLSPVAILRKPPSADWLVEIVGP